jgi:hypothetical protein
MQFRIVLKPVQESRHRRGSIASQEISVRFQLDGENAPGETRSTLAAHGK